MEYENLKLIIDSFSTLSDISKLILNLKRIKTQISAKTLKEIQADNPTVEEILAECFVKKEILWQVIDLEDIDWSLNSLIDLQTKCSNYSNKFLSVSDNRLHFYSQLLMLWDTNCNEAYKELFRLKQTSNYELYLPLRKLRINSYKIVVTLIEFLPNGNIIKDRAIEKLEFGCEVSKIKQRQILPDWTIE